MPIGYRLFCVNMISLRSTVGMHNHPPRFVMGPMPLGSTTSSWDMLTVMDSQSRSHTILRLNFYLSVGLNTFQCCALSKRSHMFTPKTHKCLLVPINRDWSAALHGKMHPMPGTTWLNMLIINFVPSIILPMMITRSLVHYMTTSCHFFTNFSQKHAIDLVINPTSVSLNLSGHINDVSKNSLIRRFRIFFMHGFTLFNSTNSANNMYYTSKHWKTTTSRPFTGCWSGCLEKWQL